MAFRHLLKGVQKIFKRKRLNGKHYSCTKGDKTDFLMNLSET